MSNYQKIEDFFGKYSKSLSKPLIKNFLKDESNYVLLINYILQPNHDNKSKVDDSFKKYYKKIRDIKYYSNLIKFFSIDYDKKVKKFKSRFTLTLDQPIGDQMSGSLKDYLVDPKSEGNYHLEESYKEEESLYNLVENECLLKAFECLTKKQLKILEYIYVKKLNNKEIAKLIDSSEQNVSNTHTKAIKKLRTYF